MIGAPPLAGRREAADDVAAAGADRLPRRRPRASRRRGPASSARTDLGHGPLVAGRRRDLAEPHHQPGHLGQPGEVLRGSPAERACSRSDAAPRRGARATAAPMNSRKSGCGRVGRLLNSGWNCEAQNHGWSRQLHDLDQAAVGRAAADHEAGRLDLVAQRGVDLVAVAVALVDDGLLAVGRARPRCPPPGATGSAPRRMVPPRSSIARCSGSRSMTA